MSRQSLKGKTVLITGASSGLGKEIALKASAEGATVILTARRPEPLEAVCRACNGGAGQAFSFSLDVTEREQITAVLEKIIATTGSIDILVNNAGFGLFAPALEMDPEITEAMFRVNVLGAIWLSQAVARQMITQGEGQIINIVSQAGKMATPKSAVYAGTKFALLGYSNALRLELAPWGIAVTTVNTGPMRTNFFEQADPEGEYLKSLGRWVLEPEKVAKRVVGAMQTKKREVNMPWLMELGAKFYVLFPKTGDYLARTLFARK